MSVILIANLFFQITVNETSLSNDLLVGLRTGLRDYVRADSRENTALLKLIMDVLEVQTSCQILSE